jgi:hypothetical protein
MIMKPLGESTWPPGMWGWPTTTAVTMLLLENEGTANETE